VNSAYAPDRATGRFLLGRRPGLDGLRGMAILFVLGTHTAYISSGIKWVLKGGYIGVDIFFVLSGFLITGLLVEEFDVVQMAAVHERLITLRTCPVPLSLDPPISVLSRPSMSDWGGTTLCRAASGSATAMKA
jgi:hypothetical protein